MDFCGKFQMRFLLKSARLAWLLACTDPASCWRHRHCLSKDFHRLSVFVSMVGLMMMLRIAWFSFLKNGWNIRFCGWCWRPRLEWKHCLTSKTLSVQHEWIGMEKTWAETHHCFCHRSATLSAGFSNEFSDPSSSGLACGLRRQGHLCTFALLALAPPST